MMEITIGYYCYYYFYNQLIGIHEILDTNRINHWLVAHTFVEVILVEESLLLLSSLIVVGIREICINNALINRYVKLMIAVSLRSNTSFIRLVTYNCPYCILFKQSLYSINCFFDGWLVGCWRCWESSSSTSVSLLFRTFRATKERWFGTFHCEKIVAVHFVSSIVAFLLNADYHHQYVLDLGDCYCDCILSL